MTMIEETQKLSIDPATKLLKEVEFIPSPNFGERPLQTEIDLLVVHSISVPENKFEGSGIAELFCNQLDPKKHPSFVELAQLRVSAHVLIRREGKMIQFVPFDKRAWHAGTSRFGAKEDCNNFSIGIELEGSGDIPYNEVQYRQLAKLARELIRFYPGITCERVVGHSDIAPGRKSDPGATFDWRYFRELID